VAVELALLPGVARPTAMLAGALAAFCPMVQKVLMALLVYGQGLAEAAASVWSHLEAGDLPWWPVWGAAGVAAVVPATLGAVTALVGLAGARSWQPAEGGGRGVSAEAGAAAGSQVTTERGKGAGRGRARVLAGLLVPVLVIQYAAPLLFAAPAALAWLAAAGLALPGCVRPLLLSRFWLAGIAISLVLGTLSGAPDYRVFGVVPLSVAGLLAACEMMLRAMVMVTGLAVAASAVGRERFLRWTRRSPVRGLGEAVDDGLRVLADASRLISAAGTKGEKGGRWQRWMTGARDAIHAMADLACALGAGDGEGAARQPVFALSGPPHSGKSTQMERLFRLLASGGVSAGGVVQMARGDAQPAAAYDAVDLRSGERRPLVSFVAAEDGRPRRAVFDESGFVQAAAWIRRAAAECSVVLVDELGRWEADGGGHMAAVLDALASPALRVLVVAVRLDAQARVLKRLGSVAGVYDVEALRREPGRLDALARRVAQLLLSA
jgi:nucleoside-triphosphatase THEP1